MNRGMVDERWWYFVSRLTVGGRPARLLFYLGRRQLPHVRWVGENTLAVHCYWHYIDLQRQTKQCSQRLYPAKALSCDENGFAFRLPTLESRESPIQLHLSHQLETGQLSLQLTPLKPLAPLFVDSTVPLRKNPWSVGWVYPRLQVEGSFHDAAGRIKEKVTGVAWFDRAWTSVHPLNMGLPHEGVIMHLDDGSELMFVDCPWEYEPGFCGSYINRDGVITVLRAGDFQWIPRTQWKSPLTGAHYPIAWTFASEKVELELAVQAHLPDQEIRGAGPLALRVWFGAGLVQGKHRDDSITGEAYLCLIGTQHLMKRLLLRSAEKAVAMTGLFSHRM